jgi:hypothetical protein
MEWGQAVIPSQSPFSLGSRILLTALFVVLPLLSFLPSCGSGRYSPSDCASKGACEDAQVVARQSVRLSWKQKDFANIGAVLYRISATPQASAAATEQAPVAARLFEINRNSSGVKISDDRVTFVLEAQEISDLKPGDCFELRAGSGTGPLSQSSEKSCL